METQRVCRFNKLGYCRFGNTCFRKHVDTMCENSSCSVLECELRHPRKCRYFLQYRYCKFGQYCRYKHEETNCEIINLKIEMEKLKNEIDEKDKNINEKESEISEHKKRIQHQLEKEKVFENKINALENANKTLKFEMEELKVKIGEIIQEREDLSNQIAVTDMLQQDFKERMRDKYLYNTEDEESDYTSDDELREKRRELFRQRKTEARRKINICDICGFTAKNGSGLKTHKRMKHKEQCL